MKRRWTHSYYRVTTHQWDPVPCDEHVPTRIFIDLREAKAYANDYHGARYANGVSGHVDVRDETGVLHHMHTY